MVDKTGLSFEIDPKSAEQGAKRIVRSLSDIRAAAEKTAKTSGKSLEQLAYGLDMLSMIKGPSSTAIRNLNGLKSALAGFRAPSAATVANATNLLKKLSGMSGPSAAASKNLASLAAALGGFRAPTATQVTNTQNLFKVLAKPPANMNGMREFAKVISDLTPKVAALNNQLLRMSAIVRGSVPGLTQVANAIKTVTNNKRAMNVQTTQAHRNFQLLGSQSLSLSGALLRTRAAFEGLFAVLALREIYNINVGFQKMEAGLLAVTGSAEGAASQMRFIDDVAQRLGLSVTEVGQGFTRFLGSIQGTAMSTVEAQKAFYGLSTAARVLHLDAQDQEGIFKALGQVMSKGSLQAEELRGQLGDRLPAAFAMMSIAMGVSTRELGDLMKKGQVTGQVLRESLGKFAVEYQKMVQGGLNASVNGLQANFARLGNSFKYLIKDLGEAGLNEAMSMLAKDLSDFMSNLRESGAIKEFGADLKAVAEYIRGMDIKGFIKNIVTLWLAFKAYSILPGIFMGIRTAVLAVQGSFVLAGVAAAQITAAAPLFATSWTTAMAATKAGMIALMPAIAAILAEITAIVLMAKQVYDIWQDITKNQARAAMSPADLARERDPAIDKAYQDSVKSLEDLADTQKEVTQFRMEDVAAQREQIDTQLESLIVTRDQIETALELMAIDMRAGRLSQDQINDMTRKREQLEVLNGQINKLDVSSQNLETTYNRMGQIQTFSAILAEAQDFGTALQLAGGNGAEAAKMIINLQTEMQKAIALDGVLSGETLLVFERLRKMNEDYRRGVEGGNSSGGESKIASTLKSLNAEINRITQRDSFGNVDRLTKLNEQIAEYQKALGSVAISESVLSRIQEARTKILSDLNDELTKYSEDQAFAVQQQRIEIQDTRNQINGLTGSRRAENDLAAAIEAKNIQRERSITLAQMATSLQIAEANGSVAEASRIRDTIADIEKMYNMRLENVEVLRQEKNALSDVAQELEGPVAQGFKSVAEAMKEGMSEALTAMISGTKKGFKDLLNSLKQSFAQGLASMIQTAYLNPVLINVLQSVGSGIGLSNGTINQTLNGVFGANSSMLGSSIGTISAKGKSSVVGGKSSLGGIGDLFSSANSLLGGGGESIFSALGMFGKGAGKVTAGLGGIVGSIGSSLGMGSLGGLGANLLGLGGGMGGTIGNIAGSLIGSAFGPLGSIAGGFLGSALGGLFGNKKPTNAAAFGNLNFDTGVANYSHMNKGNSEENMGVLKTAFDQVMTFVQGFNTLGAGTITGGITNIDMGVRDSGKATVTGGNGTKVVTAAAGQFGTLAINSLKTLLGLTNIVNEDVKTAITKTDFSDLGKAFEDLTFAANFQLALQGFRSEYTLQMEIQKQATDSAKAMNDQLKEFRDTAARLGLSVADANQATKAYVDNLVSGATPEQYTDVEVAVKTLKATWDAMIPVLQTVGYTAAQAAQKIQEGFNNNLAKMTNEFNTDIAGQIQAIVDPTAFALSQLDAQFDIIRRNGIALGADMVAIETLYGLKRQEILEQSLEAQGNSLRAWLEGELLSSTSTLSPAQKLQEAQQQFGDNLALARLGDATALGGITGNADALLAAAQEYYASSPEYASLNAFVRASLENLGSQLELPGFGPEGDTVGQLISLRQESDAQTAATIAAINEITASIDELNRRLLAYGITSGGRA